MLIKYWKLFVSAIVFIGIAGAFVGNLTNFSAFINYIFPSDDTESDIYGIWLGEYSYPVPGGVIEVNGTTEYFKSNTYNFVGEISIYVNDQGNSLHTVYQADGTGTWHADSESLTIRLDDLKSQPKSIYYNGKFLDIYTSQSVIGIEFPHIEDTIPSKITDEYKIINISDETLTLESDAPNGSMFEITMTKQKKRFQR
ncbi:MAG: hypothetical protein KZQ81_08410 [Candidatus Thiodiazotropha sp. (ex Rostrolucina anterorostrata)]|nr:hypothetical protein [Candidatus Thiodiazotropha sp. (ex Rostrolucina anterorostrata)]